MKKNEIKESAMNPKENKTTDVTDTARSTEDSADASSLNWVPGFIGATAGRTPPLPAPVRSSGSPGRNAVKPSKGKRPRFKLDTSTPEREPYKEKETTTSPFSTCSTSIRTAALSTADNRNTDATGAEPVLLASTSESCKVSQVPTTYGTNSFATLLKGTANHDDTQENITASPLEVPETAVLPKAAPNITGTATTGPSSSRRGCIKQGTAIVQRGEQDKELYSSEAIIPRGMSAARGKRTGTSKPGVIRKSSVDALPTLSILLANLNDVAHDLSGGSRQTLREPSTATSPFQFGSGGSSRERFSARNIKNGRQKLSPGTSVGTGGSTATSKSPQPERGCGVVSFMAATTATSAFLLLLLYLFKDIRARALRCGEQNCSGTNP